MDLGTAQPKASAAEEAAALDYLVDPPEEGGEQEQLQDVHHETVAGSAEGGPVDDGRAQDGLHPSHSFHAILQVAHSSVGTSSEEVHAILPVRGAKRPRAAAEKDDLPRRVRHRARREEPERVRTRRMMDISPLPLRLLVRSAVYEDITVVVAQDANISQLKQAIEEQSNSRLRESFNPVLLLGNAPLSKDFLTLKQVGIVENDTVIGFLARDTRGLIETAGLQRFHELREMAPAPSPHVGLTPTGELAAHALVGMGRDAMQGYDNFVTPPPEVPSAPTHRPKSSTKTKRQSKKASGGLTLSSLNGPQLDPSQLPPGYCQVTAADLLMSSLAAARAASQHMAKRRSSAPAAPQPRAAAPVLPSATPSQVAAPSKSTPQEAEPVAVASPDFVTPGGAPAESAQRPFEAPATVPTPAETPQAPEAPVLETHIVDSHASGFEEQVGPSLSSLVAEALPEGVNTEGPTEETAHNVDSIPLPSAAPTNPVPSMINPPSAAQDNVPQADSDSRTTPPKSVEAPPQNGVDSQPHPDRSSPQLAPSLLDPPSDHPELSPSDQAPSAEVTAMAAANEGTALTPQVTANPSLAAEASDPPAASAAEPSNNDPPAEATQTEPNSAEPSSPPPSAAPVPNPLIPDGDDDWEARAHAAAMRGNNPAPATDTPVAYDLVRPERPGGSFLGRDDGDWDKAAQQMALKGNQWLQADGADASRYVALRLASAGPFPHEVITVASSTPQNTGSETLAETVLADAPLQNPQVPYSSPNPVQTQGLPDQTQSPSPGDFIQPPFDALGTGQDLENPGSGSGLAETENGNPSEVAGEMQQSEQQWQLAVRQDKAFRQKHPTGEQRRARRLFTVGEVEALITAVERLGTGRWRDVKQRAFPLARHRTYADLKDKWKTLVRTAQIAPSQRRGIEVPENLLERVTRAHSFWRRQAEFDERYAAQYPSEHMGPPYVEGALPPYPGHDPPPPIVEEIRGSSGDAQPGEYNQARVSNPGGAQTQPGNNPGELGQSREGGESVTDTDMGPLELGYAPQVVGTGHWGNHRDVHRQDGGEGFEDASEEGTATGAAGVEPGDRHQLSREALTDEAFESQSRNAGSSEGTDADPRITSNDPPVGPQTKRYVPSPGVESLRAAYERQVSAAGEDYGPAPTLSYVGQVESATYTNRTTQESSDFHFESGRFQSTQGAPQIDETQLENGIYSSDHGVVQRESIHARDAT